MARSAVSCAILSLVVINALPFLAFCYWKLDSGDAIGQVQRDELAKQHAALEAERLEAAAARRAERVEAYRRRRLEEMMEARREENESIDEINAINRKITEESAAAARAALEAVKPVEEIVYVDLLKEYEPEIDRATKLMEEANSDDIKTLEHINNLIEKLTKAFESFQRIEIPSSQPGTVRPKLQDTKFLLASASIHTMGDRLYNYTFEQATEELANVRDNNATIVWEDVHEALTISQPERERSVLTATCPKIEKKDMDMEDIERVMKDPGVAKAEDLAMAIKAVNHFLGRRKSGGSTSSKVLPITLASVINVIKDDTSTMLERIVAVVLENRRQQEEQSGCISDEDLNDIMDEAIEGIYRKADIRDIIWNEIQKAVPAAKPIILDADFSIPQALADDPDTIKLRQLVDSEFVSKKAKFLIDALYDNIIAGQHDQLDAFIESIEESEKDRIGSIVVSQLLEAAGRVDIPSPTKVAAALEAIAPPELTEKVREVLGAM